MSQPTKKAKLVVTFDLCVEDNLTVDEELLCTIAGFLASAAGKYVDGDEWYLDDPTVYLEEDYRKEAKESLQV